MIVIDMTDVVKIMRSTGRPVPSSARADDKASSVRTQNGASGSI
jgi:hypothetical protein